MSDKKTWLYSELSPSLEKKPGIEEFNEKLKELQKIASDIAPESNLVVFLFDKKSKYRPIEKAITNLSLLNKIYNQRLFTNDPESAFEYADIKENLKKATKPIERRKKERNSRKRKK